MAVQAGFRRFRFFASEVREGPVAPAHVTCSAAGADGSLWLGCADGTVLGLAGSDLSTEAPFQAHQGCVRAIEWSKVCGVQCVTAALHAGRRRLAGLIKGLRQAAANQGGAAFAAAWTCLLSPSDSCSVLLSPY